MCSYLNILHRRGYVMGFKTWRTKDFGVMVRSGNMGIGEVANMSKDVSTCGSLSKYCREFCYMGTAYYKSMVKAMAPHAENGRIFRMIDEIGAWNHFVFDMVSLIEKKELPLFRVNVNGDLVSPAELQAWLEVARLCKDTKFWIPTKRFWWLTPSVVKEIQAVPNISVSVSVFFNMSASVKSMARQTGLPIAYCDTENVHKYKVCDKPCTTCRWCFDKQKNVFLPLHGKDALKKKRDYEEAQAVS